MFKPGDIVEIIPWDELADTYGYADRPYEDCISVENILYPPDIKRLDGVQLTIASIDSDGEIIFTEEDQNMFHVDEFYVVEEILRHHGETVPCCNPEPDIDSFFDLLSS